MTLLGNIFQPSAVRGHVAAALGFLLVLLSPLASAQGVYPPPETPPGLTLRVTGTVEVIVPFAGGYAIGGNFDQINGTPRRNLAFVDGAGALLPFGADANATVRALAVDGDALYVGGDFSSIGGASRAFAARVSLLDGSVDGGFVPAADAAVRAIALDAANAQVFLGGSFNTVNGAVRDGIAKVLASDGTLVAGWTPGYDSADAIHALVFDPVDDRLYVAGLLKLSTGGGPPRRGLGRLVGGTGALDAGWNVRMHPKGGAQVFAIALDRANGHVYLGGQFRRIVNSTRNNIARVALADGTLDGWNPNANGPVRALALDGGGLLVGGDFSTIGGGSKLRMARLDATGAADGAFSADADRVVRTIAVAGTDAIVGGAFRFLGGDTEEGIARIAAATGARDAGFAGTAGGPGRINAFAFDANGGVIAGGEFDFVEQSGDPATYARANMLRLDAGFALDTGWSADVSGDVQALAIDGTSLYIGGSFLQVTDPVGGAATARTRLARYDIAGATPVLAAWAPAADGSVAELVVNGDGIYAGGLFTSLGGAMRNFAGRLDATTGAAHGWDPLLDGPAHAIVPDGAAVFIGGDFLTAGGAARNNLAQVDNLAGTDTGVLSADSDQPVRALALSGGHLYVGGDFSLLQGAALDGAARLDAATGAVDAQWNPSIGGSVQALAFDGVNGWVYFGGEFATAGGVAHLNLARATTTTLGGVDHAWRPGSDGPVLQVAGLAGSDVLAGGAFANVTNVARGGLARIGPDGSDLTAVVIDSISPGPSVAGNAWTIAFTVQNTSGGPVPSGTVSVSTDFGEACAAPVVLDGSGQGNCAITSTVAGVRTVTASFLAGVPELMDASADAVHEVVPAAVDPVQVGSLIEATDAAATADGVDTAAVRVTLVDAFGNPVPGVAVALASSGSAVLAAAQGTTDAAGQFATTLTSIVAETVAVDAMFDASGDAVPETAVVNGAPAQVVFAPTSIPTTIAIDSHTPDPSVVGESYTVAFTVSASVGSVVGTVLVSDGAGGSCNVVLNGSENGQGNCALASAAAGDVSLVASFAGAGPFLDSSSAATTHTVSQAATALTLAVQSSIITEGDSAVFTWTLPVVAPGAGTPTGTVVVSDGGGLTCSAAIAAGGCSMPINTAGAYDFGASYAGDANFLGSSAGPVSVDVQAGGAVVTDIAVRHEIVASGILTDGSGDLVDYELEVSNIGTTEQLGVAIDMLMPLEFADIAWTCTPSGGASCGQGAGNGDIAFSADLPAGSSVLVKLAVRIVDPDDNGVETAASAGPVLDEVDTANNTATTFYRSCSGSELIGDRPLPAHVCGFRDGFELRTID